METYLQGIGIEFKYFDEFRNSSKVPTHVEKTQNFNLLDALTLMYELLDKVFGYLSYKDLKNVAAISDNLGNIIAEILNRRLSPVLFALDMKRKIPESFDIKPALCLVLNSKLYERKMLESNCNAVDYLMLHYDKEARQAVMDILDNDLLLEKCPISSLYCRQMYSSFTEKNMLNGIVFPTIPGVKMSIIRITESNKNVSELLEENIGRENNLACLLTYALSMRRKNIRNLVNTISNRQPGVKFAFGGGFVIKMKSFNRLPQKEEVCKLHDLLCIAFSVPKDAQNEEVLFNAYSIVIEKHAIREEAIQGYLEKLKSNYTPRKYGIIFRITCISREEEEKAENILIKKVFPNLEVLGFSGDGEIGWNCYDNCDTEETREDSKQPKRSKKDSKKEEIIHELTTIIVLLTWGKKTKK